MSKKQAKIIWTAARSRFDKMPSRVDNAFEQWWKNNAQQALNLGVVVGSAELVANNEQVTPIVDEDGTMTCNCAEPRQSHFPNGKWICIKCWGEWYH